SRCSQRLRHGVARLRCDSLALPVGKWRSRYGGTMIAADELILISVDDHIIEPPDLFADHLPAKDLDRAPKLVRNEQGNDVWVFGPVVMETAALNAVAGRPKEEYGMEPQSLDEVRPGCYDVHERVKDMDAGGVLASMNFPSFPTFTARTLFSDDLDLSLALV